MTNNKYDQSIETLKSAVDQLKNGYHPSNEDIKQASEALEFIKSELNKRKTYEVPKFNDQIIRD